MDARRGELCVIYEYGYLYVCIMRGETRAKLRYVGGLLRIVSEGEIAFGKVVLIFTLKELDMKIKYFF